MDKNFTFSKHFAALSLLFLLCDSILISPSDCSVEYIPLCFIFAAVLGFALYCLEIFALNHLFGGKKARFCKIFICLILGLSAVCALFFAADSFLLFCQFISTALFGNSSKVMVGILFLLVVLYLLKRNQTAVLKFSLVSAVFTIIAILLFIFANLNDYKYENLSFRFDFTFYEFFITSAKLFCISVLPSFLLPVYSTLTFGKIDKKSALSGFSLAMLLSGFCVISPVLLFGAGFTNGLKYPFAQFVSTVSIGSLFTRLDTLFYFLSFASALIKITVCLFICYFALKKINEICKKGSF